MDPVYFFWSLLPLTYLVIWFIALSRKNSSSHKKEPPKYYFNHFLFCTGTLLAAVLVDQFLYAPILSGLAEEYAGYDGFRWLVYPLVLALVATFVTYWKPTELDNKRKGK